MNELQKENQCKKVANFYVDFKWIGYKGIYLSEKACPKCGTKMSKAPTNFFLLSSLPSQRAETIADVYSHGLMLEAFACPKCDYVEFFVVKHK